MIQISGEPPEGARNGTDALTDLVWPGQRVRVNRYRRVGSASFVEYRFLPEVILVAVRWYLR